jgi:hypothetical protein
MLSIRDIRWNKKKEKPLKSLVRNHMRIVHVFPQLTDNDDDQPAGPIADAFREYINNKLPVRFIDTSKLRFISRKKVFHVFQDEIASVTEEQIRKWIRGFQSDLFATYQPQRETVLRQIIQEVVQYVILSHHWDEIGSEPTSHDISGGKRYVARFKKLAQFCKTSSELGHKLAWVDTCCIDKTNATELSEAIHVMYKWYANSYLCIVNLAESTLYVDWVGDSWFTQGWTLQELLAPKRLKFYDKSWRPFIPPGIDDNRKSVDIILPLENVTGISRAVLTADNSHGIQGHTFWEIMSWALKQQTTRTEDRAYCLIGLFHISLTIVYGEGQRAFSCLLEAISAKNPSWDVFAWFGQSSVDHFALPSSPASYSRFETDMGKDRVGVWNFTITAYGLSLKSLRLIPMELCSVADPEEPGKLFLVKLKPRSDKESSLGRYRNVLVECGVTRLKTIRGTRQLSVCIINHYAT